MLDEIRELLKTKKGAPVSSGAYRGAIATAESALDAARARIPELERAWSRALLDATPADAEAHDKTVREAQHEIRRYEVALEELKLRLAEAEAREESNVVESLFARGEKLQTKGAQLMATYAEQARALGATLTALRDVRTEFLGIERDLEHRVPEAMINAAGQTDYNARGEMRARLYGDCGEPGSCQRKAFPYWTEFELPNPDEPHGVFWRGR